MLPIYMALHIAQPDILSDAAIEHLRRFAPIGCRDLNTVRLLRNAGVPAFFNGCVTLTLDRVFAPHDPKQQAARHGRFFADYTDHGQAPGDHTFVAHLQEEIVARSFSENLAVAAGMLARYRSAEEVRTPLADHRDHRRHDRAGQHRSRARPRDRAVRQLRRPPRAGEMGADRHHAARPARDHVGAGDLLGRLLAQLID